jgi:hypothetical protein
MLQTSPLVNSVVKKDVLQLIKTSLDMFEKRKFFGEISVLRCFNLLQSIILI